MGSWKLTVNCFSTTVFLSFVKKGSEVCEFTFVNCIFQQALYKFIYEVLLWVIVLLMVLKKKKEKRSDKAIPLLESAVANLNCNRPVAPFFLGF